MRSPFAIFMATIAACMSSCGVSSSTISKIAATKSLSFGSTGRRSAGATKINPPKTRRATTQRMIRKDRRRAWAAGDRKAFN